MVERIPSAHSFPSRGGLIAMTKKTRFQIHFEADMIMMGVQSRNALAVLLFGDGIAKFLVTLRVYEMFIVTYQTASSMRLLARFGRSLVGILFRSRSLQLGFSIPPNVFGPGLRIPHYGTIVVNHRARVGACCVLHTGTCIAGGETKTIGNSLYLSTGAVVAGNVILGDNITVGANSFVNRSFPEGNALLAGAPAKQVRVREGWHDLEGEDYRRRSQEVFQLLEFYSDARIL